MSNIIDHGDHQHTELELQLAGELRQLRQNFNIVMASERLLRKALLQLLGSETSAVTVKVSPEDGIDDDDGNTITEITFYRSSTGDLDIRLAE